MSSKAFTTITLTSFFFVPCAILAQDCPMTAMNRERLVLGYAGSRSGAFHDYSSTRTRLPVVTSLSLEDAPLKAIGKLTATDDPDAEPVCTATLLQDNIILTAWSCLKDAAYFFPASTDTDRAPYGSRPIDTCSHRSEEESALCRLERPFSNPITFRTRSFGNRFPSSWMNGNYWLLAGYVHGGNMTPQIERGCNVRSYDSTYLRFECDDDFRKGAPLFGKLCGKWYIIGVETRSARGSAESSSSYWDILTTAYNKWGYGDCFGTAESCEQPTSPVATAVFEDDDIPRDSWSVVPDDSPSSLMFRSLEPRPPSDLELMKMWGMSPQQYFRWKGELKKANEYLRSEKGSKLQGLFERLHER